MPPFEQPKKTTSIFPVIIIFVLLFVAIVVIYSYSRTEKIEEKPGFTYTQENVEVSRADLSSGDKLPEGFPPFIPVDMSSTFTQSYRAAYPDRGATQYTVEYNISGSVQAEFSKYEAFLKQNAFEYSVLNDTETMKAVYATKDGDDLSLVISSNNGRVNMLISYLDRN